MLDDSNSSLVDVSREWRDKAEATPKISMAELAPGTGRGDAWRTRRVAVRDAELKSVRLTSTMATLARDVEKGQKTWEAWVITQIGDLHDHARLEIESLDALRQRQQKNASRRSIRPSSPRRTGGGRRPSLRGAPRPRSCAR